MRPIVYLVGAGPGSPDLITLRGAHVLQQADVVVYDYLANDALLTLAPQTAELIDVGKRGFTAHKTQDEICGLLVGRAREASAREGDGVFTIVRLKGGDPFVFGRGGEEALVLAQAGIGFEVVPGVTSGIAAPAFAGIPVTHRGVSSSVTFVTGNEDPTKPRTSVDWDGIAHGAETLCIFMGMRALPALCERLIAAGRPEHEPCALVRWGATPRQEVLRGTLGTVARQAAEQGFSAPAMIIVGQVAGLAEQLAWYAPGPLAGLKVAVTRSHQQASGQVIKLRAAGAEVIECPTIEICAPADYGPLDAALCALEGYDWLVLTSVNGVGHLFSRLEAVGGDARWLAGCRVAAIGDATARALAARGIRADLVPEVFRSEALAEALLDAGVGCGSRVLLARAAVAREVLVERLREAGAQVDVVSAYQTLVSRSTLTEHALSRILAGDVDAMTFTSSSTVHNLMRLLDERGMRPTQVLSGIACCSIGPVTTETLASYGIPVAAEADPYTIDGLLSAMVSALHPAHPAHPA